MLNVRCTCVIPNQVLLQIIGWKYRQRLWKFASIGNVYDTHKRSFNSSSVRIKGKVNNYNSSLCNHPKPNLSQILNNESYYSRFFNQRSQHLFHNNGDEQLDKLRLLFSETLYFNQLPTVRQFLLQVRFLHTSSFNSAKSTHIYTHKNAVNISFGKVLSKKTNLNKTGNSILYQVPTDLFRYACLPTFVAFPEETKSLYSERYYSFEEGKISVEKGLNRSDSNDENYKNKNFPQEILTKHCSYQRKFTKDNPELILPLNTKDKLVTHTESTLKTNYRKNASLDTIQKYVNNFKNSESKDFIEMSSAKDSNKSELNEKQINREQLPVDISNNSQSILHIINSIDRSEAIIHKDLYITNKVIEQMEIDKKKKSDDKTNGRDRKVEVKSSKTVDADVESYVPFDRENFIVQFDLDSSRTIENRLAVGKESLERSHSVHNVISNDKLLDSVTQSSLNQNILNDVSYLLVYGKSGQACTQKVEVPIKDSSVKLINTLDNGEGNNDNLSQDFPPNLVDNIAKNLHNPPTKTAQSSQIRETHTNVSNNSGTASDNTLDVITETTLTSIKSGNHIQLKVHEIQTFKDKRIPLTFTTDTTMHVQGWNEKLQAANDILEVAKAKLVLANTRADPKFDKETLNNSAKLMDLLSLVKHNASTNSGVKTIPIQIESNTASKCNKKTDQNVQSKTLYSENRKHKNKMLINSKSNKDQSNSTNEFNVIKLSSEELGKLLNNSNVEKPIDKQKQSAINRRNAKKPNANKNFIGKIDKHSDKTVIEIKPLIRNTGEKLKTEKGMKRESDKRNEQQRLYRDVKVPTNKLSERDIEIISKLKEVQNKNKLNAEEKIKSKGSPPPKLDISKTQEKPYNKFISTNKTKPVTYEIIKIENKSESIREQKKAEEAVKPAATNIIYNEERNLSTIGKIVKQLAKKYIDQKPSKTGIIKVVNNLAMIEHKAIKDELTENAHNISTIGKVLKQGIGLKPKENHEYSGPKQNFSENKNITDNVSTIGKVLKQDIAVKPRETVEYSGPKQNFIEDKNITENVSTIGKVLKQDIAVKPRETVEYSGPKQNFTEDKNITENVSTIGKVLKQGIAVKPRETVEYSGPKQNFIEDKNITDNVSTKGKVLKQDVAVKPKETVEYSGPKQNFIDDKNITDNVSTIGKVLKQDIAVKPRETVEYSGPKQNFIEDKNITDNVSTIGKVLKQDIAVKPRETVEYSGPKQNFIEDKNITDNVSTIGKVLKQDIAVKPRETVEYSGPKQNFIEDKNITDNVSTIGKVLKQDIAVKPRETVEYSGPKQNFIEDKNITDNVSTIGKVLKQDIGVKPRETVEYSGPKQNFIEDKNITDNVSTIGKVLKQDIAVKPRETVEYSGPKQNFIEDKNITDNVSTKGKVLKQDVAVKPKETVEYSGPKQNFIEDKNITENVSTIGKVLKQDIAVKPRETVEYSGPKQNFIEDKNITDNVSTIGKVLKQDIAVKPRETVEYSGPKQNFIEDKNITDNVSTIGKVLKQDIAVKPKETVEYSGPKQNFMEDKNITDVSTIGKVLKRVMDMKANRSDIFPSVKSGKSLENKDKSGKFILNRNLVKANKEPSNKFSSETTSDQSKHSEDKFSKADYIKLKQSNVPAGKQNTDHSQRIAGKSDYSHIRNRGRFSKEKPDAVNSDMKKLPIKGANKTVSETVSAEVKLEKKPEIKAKVTIRHHIPLRKFKDNVETKIGTVEKIGHGSLDNGPKMSTNKQTDLNKEKVDVIGKLKPQNRNNLLIHHRKRKYPENSEQNEANKRFGAKYESGDDAIRFKTVNDKENLPEKPSLRKKYKKYIYSHKEFPTFERNKQELKRNAAVSENTAAKSAKKDAPNSESSLPSTELSEITAIPEKFSEDISMSFPMETTKQSSSHPTRSHSYLDNKLAQQLTFAEAINIDLDKTCKEIKPLLDVYSLKRSVVPAHKLLEFPLLNTTKSIKRTEGGVICIDCKNDVLLRKTLRQIPSVTRVLNATMSDRSRIALARWRAKLMSQMGEAGFQEFYRGQINSGTDFHEKVRMHFRGDFIDLSQSSNLALRSVSHICNEISEVSVLESHVVHERLAYRGIIDCVAKYKHKPVIIEWKRSDKKKIVLENTFDAPLQLCAYLGAMNFDNNYPLQVEGGIVVVAYSDGSPADIFTLSMEDCENYWKRWLVRLKQYKEDAGTSSVLPDIGKVPP